LSKADRIIDRCPRFYKGSERTSILSTLINAVSNELDKVDDALTNLLNAHWVDTANNGDLDRIGSVVELKRSADEDDEHYKSHLKRAVDEYRGGGTIVSILKEFQSYFGEGGLEIIENPEVESYAEFLVIANDTWNLHSSSIVNEESQLSLTVEDEGTVSNPKITNDAGYSMTYKGELKTGQKLIIREGKAFIGDQDVSAQVKPLEMPLLPRKASLWKYSEALLEGIGIFDKTRFDEHTFAIRVPTVRVSFNWIRRQPATFLIKVNPEALSKSPVTEYYIQERLKCLRAAGIKTFVKVME
jgi:hypothetical protein